MLLKKVCKKKYILLLISLLVLTGQAAFSQIKKRVSYKKLEIHSLNDTLVPSLVNKVESYTFTIDRNNYVMKSDYDVSPIEALLPDIEKKLTSFKQRFEKTGSKMNLRSLNSAVILLSEVSDNLTSYKNILTNYTDELRKRNTEVEKILHDKELNLEIPDSTLSDQIEDVLNEGRTLDTLQKTTLAKINLLRSRVSVSLLQANDIASDMGYLSISKKINMWSREEAPLFQATPKQYEQSLLQSIQSAFQRSVRIIVIYLSGKTRVATIGLLVFILITVWCWLNWRRVVKLPNAEEVLMQVNFLKRSVWVGSLLAFFTYFPFLFANPTMSFLHANAMLRLVALIFLLLPFLTKSSKTLLAILSVLWLWYSIDDILLDSSFGERWVLFISGILLMIISLKIITTRNNFFVKIEESPATKALTIFTLALAALSLIFNLSGRLSLAKIFGVSAIQSLLLGLSLKVFCAMVLEAVYLQTEAYRESRFSTFINFKELRNRIQRDLWILASIAWIINLLHNFTLYDWFINAVSIFFNKTRNIGNYTFTFASIAVFVCIIWLSAITARFIKFFFENEKAVAGGKRSSVNSIILLIRLAIWTTGFLIAVAAAGIPIDRLSIMLGALGVGIGFGLQNIVNNLVSGVILAFEQPIQVGDQIEIGNKAGTVREIGVRSSTLRNAEGANIIVPNGDLLSQQLVNWTLQDRNKRVDFTLSVAYGADIEMIKTLIVNQLKDKEGVLQTPEPSVVVQEFGEYGIAIKTLFWVEDLSKANKVRTNVMINIKKVLEDAGVQLQLRPLG